MSLTRAVARSKAHGAQLFTLQVLRASRQVYKMTWGRYMPFCLFSPLTGWRGGGINSISCQVRVSQERL